MQRFKTREEFTWPSEIMMAEEHEKNHSSIGASSASRWMECPGSIKRAEKIPDKLQVTGVDAAWGTVGHRLMEKALTMLDFIALDNADILYWLNGWNDTEVTQDGHEIIMNEDMADAVFEIVADVKSVMAHHNAPYEYLSVEKFFTIEKLDKDARGTVDAMLEIPFDTLYIWDLKTGYKTVEAVRNPQLMYYAMGAFTTVASEVTKFVATIVQPRSFHAKGPVRSYEFDFKELNEFGHEIIRAIAETKKDNALLKAGSHCKYCPAKVECPEIERQAAQVVSTEFSVIPDPKEISFEKANEMLPERLTKILEFGRLFEDWIGAVREVAFVLANSGVKIPGYKLVAKKANRVWGSVAQAEAELKKIIGPDAFIKSEPKFVSPAQAEKIFKAKKLDFSMLPEITKPDNGTVLTFEDDKRPEVLPGIVTEFTVVEDTSSAIDLSDL